MGEQLTKCCTQNISHNTEVSIDDEISDPKLLELVTPAVDARFGLNFLISKDYYSLLVQKLAKLKMIKTLCSNLSNGEVLSLIRKLIEWIVSFNIDKVDSTLKIIVGKIKLYNEISTRALIKEIKKYQGIGEGSENTAILYNCLSNFSIVSQILQFLMHNKKNDIEIYKINLWEGKNIFEECKFQIFEGTFFLHKIKDKIVKSNENDFINSDTNFNENTNIKSGMKLAFNDIKGFVDDLFK